MDDESGTKAHLVISLRKEGIERCGRYLVVYGGWGKLFRRSEKLMMMILPLPFEGSVRVELSHLHMYLQKLSFSMQTIIQNDRNVAGLEDKRVTRNFYRNGKEN